MSDTTPPGSAETSESNQGLRWGKATSRRTLRNWSPAMHSLAALTAMAGAIPGGAAFPHFDPGAGGLLGNFQLVLPPLVRRQAQSGARQAGQPDQRAARPVAFHFHGHHAVAEVVQLDFRRTGRPVRQRRQYAFTVRRDPSDPHLARQTEASKRRRKPWPKSCPRRQKSHHYLYLSAEPRKTLGPFWGPAQPAHLCRPFTGLTTPNCSI